MDFRQLRERVNLFLYDNKSKVLRVGKILNVIVSLIAMSSLVYYYGFQHDQATEEMLLGVIKMSFVFYVLHFLLRFIYSFQPIEFLRKNWFEGIIMFLLTVEGISYNVFDFLLLEKLALAFGFNSFTDLSALFIQLYILAVVLIGIGRGGGAMTRFKLNPAVIFITSFAVIIFMGTGLLMLPEMTVPDGGMNFLDALFTSTSATCVTGLMVEDTPTFFTFKGQVVLLILIKLGGLNIIAFGSFLVLASRFGLRVKQHDVIEDFVNNDSHLSAESMLGKVIIWSTGMEILGAIMMFIFWDEAIPFESNGQRAFYSIFHSVSAFNNAGISLFTDGLYNEAVRFNFYIHWLVTILVFFGALGMVAVFDLFDPQNLRERMRAPWKRIGFMTKIALYFSIGLVIIGSVGYYIMEYNGTLAGYNQFGKITTAVFQSVTRTSGFNTVDFGSVGVPSLFMLIVLMFIGSSSSSTGGGIKTSTLAIVGADIWSTIRGASNTELFKRTISPLLKSRAYSVLVFFLIFDVIGIFALSISESHILANPNYDIIDLAFEEVSALGTVGLSTGITSLLSPFGKLVIIASMFVGRVGTLTVAFAVGVNLISKNYRYPEGHTMVG
ncbi:TrkH family potassium uptake protein [Sanyastnella coralliicola]|uniref:TrkH family potassium uptake protein n=1 Tax=Sanyastnella coralliicola TaxID=3069118 RepID=UPI0027BAF149|nr:potassium transporter TrkG [Longitalea sp. SCSIO 12813]